MEKYKVENIKKALPYIGILIVGILLGTFVFRTDSVIQEQNAEQKEEKLHYTCSMHPQYDSSEEGQCPHCGMDLIVSNNTSVLSQSKFEMGEEAIALANIQTMVVDGSIEKKGELVLSGVIQSNENTNAVQTTLFDGRIDKLYIKSVGEYVKQGDEIGVIYSPELYLAQDKLLTSASYKDTHEKLYNAARNSLGLWKMTDEQIDEILESGKPMVNFPLIADVSGTVTEIIANEGNYYDQGDALFKVSNLNSVWAVFDAYESQIGSLKKNQEVVLRLNALKGKKIKGRISFIEPLLQASKRTVAVRVEIPNPKGELKPGMFAEAVVSINREGKNIMVPKSAVLWTGKRSIVYRKPIPTSSTFEMVEIVLGDAYADEYEVLDGLVAGDEIVINGTFTVDAAAQLSRKNSMIQRNRQPMEMEKEVPKELQINSYTKSKIGDVLGSYLMLKDALVSTDIKQSTLMAKTFTEVLQGIETDKFNNEELKLAIANIKPIVKDIAAMHDIEHQRNSFKPLSEEMVSLAKRSPSFGRTLYVQFCPMADKNKGASWISLNEKISNPYFGDKMLTCGSVKEVLD